MIRQLAEERPSVQPGPAGWFLRGGTCRQAGLISHRLVFGVLVELSARKNQPKAIAYTDLLAAGGVFKGDKKRFRCHDWQRTILVVFNISCDYTVYLFMFLSCKILNGILKVFKI